MKILLVAERHRSGGAQEAFMQQSRLLTMHGHSVAHFTLGFNPREVTCEVPHYVAFPDILGPLKKNPALKSNLMDKRHRNRLLRSVYFLLTTRLAAMRLRQAVRAFQPDVVHFHSVAEFMKPALFRVPRQLGVASVLTVHDTWPICPSRQLLKGGTEPCDGICAMETLPGQSCREYRCIADSVERFFNVYEFHKLLKSHSLTRDFDMVLAPSQALADRLVQTGQAAAERTRCHRSMCRLELLEIPLEDSPPLYPPPPGEREPSKGYFLAPGRMTSYKGFGDLVNAFAALPEIPLVIVGDGPEYGNIAADVEARGLRNIRLVGRQSGEALWQLYRECYSVVVPSRYFEALGLVILEGFAYGKPVIGSNTGGIPELVRHGETGLLFEPGDIAGLKAQVQALWAQPEQAAQWGRQGYARFHAEFSQAHLYEEIIQIYTEALAHQTGEKEAYTISIS